MTIIKPKQRKWKLRAKNSNAKEETTKSQIGLKRASSENDIQSRKQEETNEKLSQELNQPNSGKIKLKLSLEIIEQEEVEFSEKEMTILMDSTVKAGNQPRRKP